MCKLLWSSAVWRLLLCWSFVWFKPVWIWGPNSPRTKHCQIRASNDSKLCHLSLHQDSPGCLSGNQQGVRLYALQSLIPFLILLNIASSDVGSTFVLSDATTCICRLSWIDEASKLHHRCPSVQTQNNVTSNNDRLGLVSSLAYNFFPQIWQRHIVETSGKSFWTETLIKQIQKLRTWHKLCRFACKCARVFTQTHC